MKFTITRASLVALGLLLAIGFAQALDSNSKTPQSVTSKATANSEREVAEKNIKGKVIAKNKLVDINSAKKEELKKLPGITEDDATKIIVGRPYGSKTWIVGPNGLTEAKYLSVKDKIIAKQPYKDAAKNAALYKK